MPPAAEARLATEEAVNSEVHAPTPGAPVDPALQMQHQLSTDQHHYTPERILVCPDKDEEKNETLTGMWHTFSIFIKQIDVLLV